MDVDSLKAELEKHLAKNPDEHAPHGFRDRFNTLVEQYQSEGDSIPKPVLEQELQQIRNEAEAAAKAAGTEPADDLASAPRSDVVAAPPAPSAPVEAPADEPADTPSSGLGMGTILILVAVIVVLAGAYYFFRR
jgi:hypothetical protein